jgi:hypothetical protein
LNLNRNPDYDASAHRDAVVTGLEKTIEAGVPEGNGVTLDHLRDILELARADWSIPTLIGLYHRNSEITGKPFDEAKLFPNQK